MTPPLPLLLEEPPVDPLLDPTLDTKHPGCRLHMSVARDWHGLTAPTHPFMPGNVQVHPDWAVHAAAVALLEQGCTAPPQPPSPSDTQPGQ